MRGGCKVYDEEFHRGINIIRGHNSPGKSTVMSFIFYGLGGESIKWTSEQLMCDKIFLDVIVNGNEFCLSREITESATADVYVCDDFYDEAYKSENWYRFSRTRSAERESFSEWFFNALQLPQHKTDSAANLTMHQILRLMFFDQSTAAGRILREESSFDSREMRRSIGDYLLGLDNLEGRQIRQQLIDLSKRLGSLNGQVKAIHRFFGKEVQDIKQDVINANIEAHRAEIAIKTNTLKAIEDETYEDVDEVQKQLIKNLKRQIAELDNLLNEKEGRSQWLNSEITDNEIFLYTLKERLNDLNHSERTNTILDGVSFKFCPLCLSEIKADDGNGDCCPLCKRSHSDSQDNSYVQFSTELKFQIKETRSVIELQKEELERHNAEIPHLKSKFYTAQKQLHEQVSSVSPAQAAVETISKQIGYIEAIIEKEEKNLVHAAKLEGLYESKKGINEEIESLNERLDELDASNRERDISVRRMLESKVIDLVKQDSGDEKSFDNPQTFTFDFRADSFMLDDKPKISDSSMVILKNSFGLALFLESISDQQIRIPRFMLFDNIEDKGMREERSANFQRLIVKECADIDEDMQLIMTTSMIAEELDGSDYCVGPYYDRNHPTLDFSKCKL